MTAFQALNSLADKVNIQLDTDNMHVGNRTCFGRSSNGNQKFTVTDSNNRQTISLDSSSRVFNIVISPCGRENRDDRISRRRLAADRIIEGMKELYGADKVEQVLKQNPTINLDRGLRLREVHALVDLMIRNPDTHHHKHKTVHPLSPDTTVSARIQTPGDTTPPNSTTSTTNDSPPSLSGNITDSPIQEGESVQQKHMQAVKILEEKSALRIAELFVKEGHSRSITKEAVSSMIDEEFLQLNSTKEPFLCKIAFTSKIQAAIHKILEEPSFSEDSAMMQIRINRRACRLNTLLLSFILEGKGKEIIEAKKAAQDIIGTILVNCPSQTITYELLHDYVIKASTQEGKFNYNPKLPYYLSKALCDFLIDETTTEEAKMPFRKRFTALNTLLTSPTIMQQLQGLECLSSAPPLLSKTRLPEINALKAPNTRTITELEMEGVQSPSVHRRVQPGPYQSIHLLHPITTVSYHPAAGLPFFVRNNFYQ